MNGYEIVDKLIKDKKRYVSINELFDMGDNHIDKDVAIMLLKNLYSGKYIEPWDSHCCGSYSFENPNCKKVPMYQLYTLYLPKDENKGIPEILESKNSEYFETIISYIKFHYKDNLNEREIMELKNTHHCWLNENQMLFWRMEENYKYE